jgi:riboflavin biosynthesis pyrimidine reductase
MDIDLNQLLETYIADRRSHPSGSPWTMLNMISSKNGLATYNGKSGPLGGPADKALFRTLRGLADVILVAAGTARSEKYSVPIISERTTEIRRTLHKAELPTIVVVSNSLDLDPLSPLFTNINYRPAILTSTSCPKQKEIRLRDTADVFRTAGDHVNLLEAIPYLGKTYGPLILVEGGPNLNKQLVELDLFDELCITTSPLVSSDVGSPLITTSTHYKQNEMILDRVLGVDSFSFKRYLRNLSR